MDDLAILVCGKTGVGKSTLVNSILRADLVPAGGPGSRLESSDSTTALDPVTSRIEEVTGNVRGANIRVFDSPGLQDGTDRDDEYLDMMSKVVDRSDLVLYCFEMTASRWLAADQIAIELITKRFGVEFWFKCVVVLTKANQFQFSKRTKNPQKQAEWCAYCEKAFLDIMATFKKKLEALLPKEHYKIIESIPVIAAGGNEDDPEDRTLLFVAPDVKDQDYLAEMWVKCLLRLPPNEKRLAFFKAANFEEMRSKDVDLTDVKSQEEDLRDQIRAANVKEINPKEDLTGIKSQEKNSQTGIKSQEENSQIALSANLSTMPVGGSPAAQSATAPISYTPVKENNVQINLNDKQTEEAIKAKSESLSFFNIVLGSMAMGACIGGKVETAIQAGTLVIPGLQAASLTYHIGRVAIQGVTGISVGAGVGAGVGLVAGTIWAIGKWLFN